jgi:hypothetical protein
MAVILSHTKRCFSKSRTRRRKPSIGGQNIGIKARQGSKNKKRRSLKLSTGFARLTLRDSGSHNEEKTKSPKFTILRRSNSKNTILKKEKTYEAAIKSTVLPVELLNIPNAPFISLYDVLAKPMIDQCTIRNGGEDFIIDSFGSMIGVL